MRVLRIDKASPYQQLIGVGGIGTGMLFALEGDHSLGRIESRPGRLLDVRDYCKLHIIIHYVAKLLGASHSGFPFHVLPVGKVGDDAPGRMLLNEMADVGIDTRFVRTIAGKPTLFSVCFQYPNGDGGNITTSNSAAAALSETDLTGIGEVLASSGKRTIVLAAPEVPMTVRRRLLELATEAGALRVASLVSSEVMSVASSGMIQLVDLLSVNEEEAAMLVSCEFRPHDTEPFVDACLRLVAESAPDLRLIVTAGEHGAYGFGDGIWNYCPAPRVGVASTAGAGDALLGGVLAAMAAGLPLLQPGAQRKALTDSPLGTALELGVLLASLKCLSPHTIHPYASVDTLVQLANDLELTLASEINDSIAEGVLGVR